MRCAQTAQGAACVETTVARIFAAPLAVGAQLLLSVVPNHCVIAIIAPVPVVRQSVPLSIVFAVKLQLKDVALKMRDN